MTADQFIQLLFENHWIVTTIIIPQLTLLYAIATDHTAWASVSLFLWILKEAF